MMGSETLDVGLFASFAAGVVAFLSPCVLPLMPGYLSIVTRLSYDDLSESRTLPKFSKVFLPSMVFILGFSTVFVSLGAFSSHMGNLIAQNRTLLLRIAGIFIIFFGIFVMEIIKIPFLQTQRQIHVSEKRGGFIGTYLLGFAFGFGWVPCIGPILGSILLYASTAQRTFDGIALLTVYSLGIGIPFILVGLAYNGALRWLSGVRKYYRFYNYAVGGCLIIVGIMMFSNDIYYLNIYGQKVFDALGIDFWKKF